MDGEDGGNCKKQLTMRIPFVFIICLLFTTLFAQKVNYPLHILQFNGEIYNKNKKLSKNDIINSINFIRFTTTHDELMLTDQKQSILSIRPKGFNRPYEKLNCNSPGVDCTPIFNESIAIAREYNYEDSTVAQYVVNPNYDFLPYSLSTSSNNFTLIYKYRVIKNHASQINIKLIFPYNPK